MSHESESRKGDLADVWRGAVRVALSVTSIRALASEIQIPMGTLESFLIGRKPHAKTGALIGAWYERQRAGRPETVTEWHDGVAYAIGHFQQVLDMLRTELQSPPRRSPTQELATLEGLEERLASLLARYPRRAPTEEELARIRRLEHHVAALESQRRLSPEDRAEIEQIRHEITAMLDRTLLTTPP
jgi:hypothetical protein